MSLPPPPNIPFLNALVRSVIAEPKADSKPCEAEIVVEGSEPYAETPANNILVLLKAKGASVAEISKHTRTTDSHIRRVLSQPWARQRVTEWMLDGVTDVNSYLHGELVASLQTIANIRDDPKASSAVRMQAALTLIERLQGKAVVKVRDDRKTVETTPAEIDSELARLDAELQTVVGREPARPFNANS